MSETHISSRRKALFFVSIITAAVWFLRPSPAKTQSAPKSVAAVSPFIDVHTHLDETNVDASMAAAIRAMPEENLANIVFMPSPFTLADASRFDVERLMPAAKKYPGKIYVLGGGGTLNPMLIEAARTGNVGPEVQKKFKERAEAILAAGAVGFGEMTTEHFPSSTPYQHAEADGPLLLLLADVAAQHDVPISIHMEAVPQDIDLPAPLKSPPNPSRLHANIAAFERLLSHNPRAKIVWAHLGWDTTGYRTPELARRLLEAHPNLFMEIKLDPLDVEKNSPLADGASGKIKPEWLKLFTDFQDRFVIGSDQHYPMSSGPQRWQAIVALFNQLPAGVRQKIGTGNAIRIYRLK
ncbi:MAG TPA: amidohydrolase family protein [Candidatus Acidoferrales bacterium]|jgi:predicted TIM-barrel fold metal-dependent hydrolase|nr:amidohydrolase family protein [Candidatus Acidoferrales bacterium]